MKSVEIFVPDGWETNKCPVHNMVGLDAPPQLLGEGGPVFTPGLFQCFAAGMPHYFRIRP